MAHDSNYWAAWAAFASAVAAFLSLGTSISAARSSAKSARAADFSGRAPFRPVLRIQSRIDANVNDLLITNLGPGHCSGLTLWKSDFSLLGEGGFTDADSKTEYLFPSKSNLAPSEQAELKLEFGSEDQFYVVEYRDMLGNTEQLKCRLEEDGRLRYFYITSQTMDEMIRSLAGSRRSVRRANAIYRITSAQLGEIQKGMKAGKARWRLLLRLRMLRMFFSFVWDPYVKLRRFTSNRPPLQRK